MLDSPSGARNGRSPAEDGVGAGHEAGAFFERLRPQLSAYAYRLTHNYDDAADLVQTTWLYAWRRWDCFEPIGGVDSVHAWLRKIMLNAYVNLWRRDRRVWQPTAQHNYPCRGEAVCELDDISKALPLLTPLRLNCLLMAACGYGYDEIAREQRIGVGTVKSSVSRAGDRLRALLGPEYANKPRLRARNQQRVDSAAPSFDRHTATGALSVEV